MYNYVGPRMLIQTLKVEQEGKKIKSNIDVNTWILETSQIPNNHNEITATFIIDSNLYLRVSDRHSEHVACAGGKQVFSAGEITFEVENGEVTKISQITNQSTGYCPDASSWQYVEKVLAKLNLPYPAYFTQAFVFKICDNCGSINIIKDNFFVCSVCGMEWV